MSTITKGTTVLTPTLVLGYETSRESLNQIHELVSGRTTATLAPALPRRGTLRLFFATKVDAWACFTLHATPGQFAFADTDIAQTSMNYVVNGTIDIRLDPETRVRWLVDVPYQELSS